ncbi:MAG: hypothetical protein PWQ63_127 [Methanolobus sp.]|nr:hypothetical protein [Methanolobus sp.]
MQRIQKRRDNRTILCMVEKGIQENSKQILEG